MDQKPVRLVLFTAGRLTPEVRVFINSLIDHGRIELAAIVVDAKTAASEPSGSFAERFKKQYHNFWVPANDEPGYDILRAPGTRILYVDDVNSAVAAERIRALDPELGAVVRGPELEPNIIEIPRLGCLDLQCYDAQKYGSAAPVGLRERMNGDATLGLTVRRASRSEGSDQIVAMRQIPIERFDNEESLALKAAIHGFQLFRDAIDAIIAGSTEHLIDAGAASATHDTTISPLRRRRFWCAHRQVAAEATRRPDRSWRDRLVVGSFRWARVAGSLGLLPYLARRRRKLEESRQAPIVIFFYHGVGNQGENWMTLPLEQFHRQVTYLKTYFKILPLEEALRRLRAGENDETAAVLTFDDAYENCYRNLLPYASFFDLPITMFACARASAEGRRHDHDLEKGFPNASLMSSEQLREMAATGVEIGSHGNYHEDFGTLKDSELNTAMVESGAQLERLVGRPIRSFSFPFGAPRHMSAEAIDVAQTRYDAVFSAYGGYNFPDPDNSFHFQRISAPDDISSMMAIMNGLHRMRPFYVERPQRLAGRRKPQPSSVADGDLTAQFKKVRQAA